MSKISSNSSLLMIFKVLYDHSQPYQCAIRCSEKSHDGRRNIDAFHRYLDFTHSRPRPQLPTLLEILLSKSSMERFAALLIHALSASGTFKLV